MSQYREVDSNILFVDAIWYRDSLKRLESKGTTTLMDIIMHREYTKNHKAILTVLVERDWHPSQEQAE